MSNFQSVTPKSDVPLEAYANIIGKEELDDLRRLGDAVAHTTIQHVNSTAQGGGVAELLNRIVPMVQELGVQVRWDVLTGTEDFFYITKVFHNALHGRAQALSAQMFSTFREYSRQFTHTFQAQGDVLFIHDPQPIGLIRKRAGDSHAWIWRCHVDVSQPNAAVWRFLQRFVMQYDAAVFSAAHFSKRMPIRQFLIAPSIDPLSRKNMDLEQSTVRQIFQRLDIPQDLPIITQISRFDRLKDPVGVIRMFRVVSRYAKCRLVLAGGGATDDPEGAQVLAEVRAAAHRDPMIHIVDLPVGSDREINALQRGSTVILQKSLREGFGLTVTEALWKRKPVVASAVGGIPLQVIHRFSGLLCHSIEGAALAVRQLLLNPQFAQRLGDNAREHVRHNFLVTRHVQQNLLLALALRHKEDIIRLV